MYETTHLQEKSSKGLCSARFIKALPSPGCRSLRDVNVSDDETVNPRLMKRHVRSRSRSRSRSEFGDTNTVGNSTWPAFTVLAEISRVKCHRNPFRGFVLCNPLFQHLFSFFKTPNAVLSCSALAVVMGDGMRMRLSNSVKFSPEISLAHYSSLANQKYTVSKCHTTATRQSPPRGFVEQLCGIRFRNFIDHLTQLVAVHS
jgi:hypothetical protein